MKARYFFDVVDGRGGVDSQGRELRTPDDAKIEAVRLAAQMMQDDPELRWQSAAFEVEVSDRNRVPLFSVFVTATDCPTPR